MARPPTGSILERRGKRGRTYALRFRAYGRRHYLTLGSADEGWTLKTAEEELERTLAAVKLGVWQPPRAEPVVVVREQPTFHVFASEWFEQKKLEGLQPRTLEHLQWALSAHLLPHFAALLLPEITAERIDGYRGAKVREREQGEVERPLSNSSINRTIQTLAQVLDSAHEYGHIGSNPARGRRRRLKSAKPRRRWLELDEVRSLLAAAKLCPGKVDVAPAKLARLIGKANRARNKAGLDRQRDTGERMDALLRGADWAQTGTNGTNGNGAVPSMATERAL